MILQLKSPSAVSRLCLSKGEVTLPRLIIPSQFFPPCCSPKALVSRGHGASSHPTGPVCRLLKFLNHGKSFDLSLDRSSAWKFNVEVGAVYRVQLRAPAAGENRQNRAPRRWKPPHASSVSASCDAGDRGAGLGSPELCSHTGNRHSPGVGEQRWVPCWTAALDSAPVFCFSPVEILSPGHRLTPLPARQGRGEHGNLAK